MTTTSGHSFPLDVLPAFRKTCVDPVTGAVDYRRLMTGVIEVIKEIDPTLDLSTLKDFSAGPDYDAVLAAVSARVGREMRRTKRESGSGQAMVVHDKTSDTLVTSFGLIEAVYGSDQDLRDVALNSFHHELCHAHDAAVLRRNFPGVMLSPQQGGVWSWRLYPIANALWAEYSANRRSFATLPKAGCMHTPLLATEIATVTADVRESIKSYRRHLTVDALLDEAAPHVYFVFMLAGYILGTLHAAGRELEGDAAAALRGSFLEPAWNDAAPLLARMYQSHGQWPGLAVFRPLEDAVRGAFRRLGLHMTTAAGGAYLEVPFTPETLAQ